MTTPLTWLNRISDWQQKHPLPFHQIEITSPQRYVPPDINDKIFEETNLPPWWLEYAENVDIKLAYAASAAFTIGLETTPLASSATLVLGRESTAVSITTNLYLDYLVGGKVTTGTSPTTAKSIEIYLYGSIDDTPTYPDVLDGTDSDETFTSVDIRNACVTFFNATATDATSNRTYWFRPMCVAAFFGGRPPKNFGLWVTHDTGVALNATGTNHLFAHTGGYMTG